MFVALNLAVWAALAVVAAWRSDVPPHIDSALRRLFPDLDESGLAALRRESTQQLVYEPFTQFRDRAQQGRFVNVDPAGFRRSSGQGPWPIDSAKVNVFLFGGSTTFGYGVADDQTIASRLAIRLAAIPGARPTAVYNFGHAAYYSSQERVLFEQLLAHAHVPDVAIFIDGLNDFYSAGEDRPAGADNLALWMEKRARPTWTDVLDLLPVGQLAIQLGWWLPPRLRLAAIPDPALDEAGQPLPHDSPAVTDRVIALYLRNQAMIDAVAERFGVRAVFVWQPVPVYRYDLRFHTYRGDFGRTEYARYGYPRFAERLSHEPLGARFLWCADLQEGVQDLLYVDQVHYSPAMSDRVAGCIADLMAERGLLSGPGAAARASKPPFPSSASEVPRAPSGRATAPLAAAPE